MTPSVSFVEGDSGGGWILTLECEYVNFKAKIFHTGSPYQVVVKGWWSRMP